MVKDDGVVLPLLADAVYQDAVALSENVTAVVKEVVTWTLTHGFPPGAGMVTVFGLTIRLTCANAGAPMSNTRGRNRAILGKSL